jgi:hypothetical protein
MRLTLSQEVLAFLFGIGTQSCVSDIISTVGKVLEEEFVPKFLGYNHISREDFIKNHTCAYAQTILESAPGAATVVIDATYLYFQKPTDHELQRRTFSAHKKRNLLKPMVIAAVDGYVLDVRQQ